MTNEVMTTSEAAKMLGASAKQVSNLVRCGRLIGRSFGKQNARCHYVLASSVREFLSRGQTKEAM